MSLSIILMGMISGEEQWVITAEKVNTLSWKLKVLFFQVRTYAHIRL